MVRRRCGIWRGSGQQAVWERCKFWGVLNGEILKSLWTGFLLGAISLKVNQHKPTKRPFKPTKRPFEPTKRPFKPTKRDHLNQQKDHLNQQKDHLNQQKDHLNQQKDHLNQQKETIRTNKKRPFEPTKKPFEPTKRPFKPTKIIGPSWYKWSLLNQVKGWRRDVLFFWSPSVEQEPTPCQLAAAPRQFG